MLGSRALHHYRRYDRSPTSPAPRLLFGEVGGSSDLGLSRFIKGGCRGNRMY